MSHYIYRKKIFAETTDGFILPFACYSDSSVWAGSGRNMHHPKSWCVMNLGFNHLFVKRDEWAAAAAEEYDRQIRLLTDFEARQHSGKTVTENSYTYSGNTYPGGGRLKYMRAFYSIRHTIPFDDFLRKYWVTISLEALKPNSWDGYEQTEIGLSSEENVALAEQEYQRLITKYPDTRGICVGVNGLYY